MSELERLRENVRSMESCLDASDWDALAALVPVIPASAFSDGDVASLAEVLSDVERLQHRIETAMGEIEDELGDVPQMRKAARAYGSHG